MSTEAQHTLGTSGAALTASAGIGTHATAGGEGETGMDAVDISADDQGGQQPPKLTTEQLDGKPSKRPRAVVSAGAGEDTGAKRIKEGGASLSKPKSSKLNCAGELKLVSTIDQGVTNCAMVAVVHAHTLNPSDNQLDPSEPLLIPARTEHIKSVVHWLHGWHCAQGSINGAEQVTIAASFFTQLKCEQLYAILEVADYLQVDSLVEAIMQQLFGDAGQTGAAEQFRQRHGLQDDLQDDTAVISSATLSTEQMRRRRLERFGGGDSKSNTAPKSVNEDNLLLSTLTKTNPTCLSWVQLDMCIFICQRLRVWAEKECTRRRTAIEAEKTAHWYDKRVDLECDLEEAELASLDQMLWDAVENSDLEAAKRAYAKGACPDLARVPKKGNDEVVIVVPLDKVYFKGALDGNSCDLGPTAMADELITTLMMAATKDDLNMINWLCDVGCDINGSLDAAACCGAQGGGGFTALWFASAKGKLLLCARGANVNVYCREDGYEDTRPRRSVLLSDSVAVGGTVAESLVQHGADVNAIEAPGEDSDCGPKWGELNSYWPRVVCSGDIVTAAKLLDKHQADVNWPQSIRASAGRGTNPETDEIVRDLMLGRTVLMMAIQKEHVAMVELLLEHGADVNLTEFVDARLEFVEFALEDGQDAEFAEDYFDASGEVIENKKATPLSVALGTRNAAIIKMLQARGAVAHDDNATTPCEGIGFIEHRKW